MQIFALIPTTQEFCSYRQFPRLNDNSEYDVLRVSSIRPMQISVPKSVGALNSGAVLEARPQTGLAKVCNRKMLQK